MAPRYSQKRRSILQPVFLKCWGGVYFPRLGFDLGQTPNCYALPVKPSYVMWLEGKAGNAEGFAVSPNNVNRAKRMNLHDAAILPVHLYDLPELRFHLHPLVIK
jgi:hypothetical protein